MPRNPELLKSTALIVSLDPPTPTDAIRTIEYHVKEGEIEEAILFVSDYCFDATYPRSFLMRRHLLKRLWNAIEAFYEGELDIGIHEQIQQMARHGAPSKLKQPDGKAAFSEATQEDVADDMRRALRFARRLERCKVLFEMMFEDNARFSPQGLNLMRDLLVSCKDGA